MSSDPFVLNPVLDSSDLELLIVSEGIESAGGNAVQCNFTGLRSPVHAGADRRIGPPHPARRCGPADHLLTKNANHSS